METDFKTLLNQHLEMVDKKLVLSSMILCERAVEHDKDKIFNPIVYAAYNKYFPELKKIPFGTEEYKNFEKKYFDQAHQIHAQNRHHFYSPRNHLDDINLFDLIEAIIDISESSRQYGEFKNYKNALRAKGVYDYDLEEMINNTVEYLNSRDNGKCENKKNEKN